MKWALLGMSDEVLAIAEHARARGHSLVVAYEAADWEQSLQAIAPTIRLGAESDWESLLYSSEVEAVIVAPLPSSAAQQQTRHDQLRKLCQAGVPMLLVHPACDSIIGFELDMIRRDTFAPLVPYTAGVKHPSLERMRTLLRQPSDELGAIEQVVFERTLARRDEAAVLTRFSQDVLLLMQVVDEIRQVNAMGTLTNLSVQMGRRDDLLIRWSLAPGEGPSRGKLALIGARGRIELEMSPDGTWQGTLPGENAIDSSHFTAADGVSAALAEVERSIDQPVPHSSGENPSTPAASEVNAAWFAACRSGEIAEVVPRCLARGRTIELFYDDAPTEEATFKGMMAAGGCGILVFVLLILVLFSVIEGIRLPGLRSQYERERQQEAAADQADRLDESNRSPLWLRLWPVYPLAVFLVLQLLRLVFRSSPKEGAARGEESATEKGKRRRAPPDQSESEEDS